LHDCIFKIPLFFSFHRSDFLQMMIEVTALS